MCGRKRTPPTDPQRECFFQKRNKKGTYPFKLTFAQRSKSEHRLSRMWPSYVSLPIDDSEPDATPNKKQASVRQEACAKLKGEVPNNSHQSLSPRRAASLWAAISGLQSTGAADDTSRSRWPYSPPRMTRRFLLWRPPQTIQAAAVVWANVTGFSSSCHLRYISLSRTAP